MPKLSQIRFLPIFLFFLVSVISANTNRTFEVDYDNNVFLKDGKPFRYVSGSIHYFRLVEDNWDGILQKMRLAGLNAITTYVEWRSHQPTPKAKYNFDLNLDLFRFLDTAKNNDLLVILRPGPYMDAERDMGGLPAWLLWQKENMKLRSSDLDYVYFVIRWFDVLLPLLEPYLYKNGGPIIMFQVENEYGSYGCDRNYTSFLRDLLRFHLGEDVVLFTTDGAGDSYVNCGKVPNVYPTVDFGPELDAMVDLSFAVQRRHAPEGPLINSEYYPGWLDHWQRPHSTRSTRAVVSTLDKMLSMGANVNIYMFYGGTSFGWGAGANIDGSKYESCPTSYDYDAPLTEAGDPTEKYFAIKSTISKYLPVPTENPMISPKANYGKVALQPVTHILHPEFIAIFSWKRNNSIKPLSFEQLKVGSGMVVYQTKIDFITTDPSSLSAPDMKDRAYVYLDLEFVGVLSRTENIYSLPVVAQQGQTLSILVENQGRVCFGAEINESKGIGAEVSLGVRSLLNWSMIPLGELDGKLLTKYSLNTPQYNTIHHETSHLQSLKQYFSLNNGAGTLFFGNFSVTAANGTLLDTFIRLDGFTKGMVFVNNFNLGRYWPNVGPQQTLFLPAPLLKPAPAVNYIVVFELEKSPAACVKEPSSEKNKCYVSLIDTHVIDGPTPYKEGLKMTKHEISYI